MFFLSLCVFLFCFNYPSSPEIYTLSLHDALPILLSVDGSAGLWSAFEVRHVQPKWEDWHVFDATEGWRAAGRRFQVLRSEEHTSELQSLRHLVCRLLLEKKKKTNKHHTIT